ncbi:MAG: SurA N-terminal domain-containing protein [Thermodesulfobacteriota bacterium]
MLDFMRSKAQSTLIQAAILGIVLVFIFWGVNQNQQGGPDAVATVNGKKVSYQNYSRAYEQLMNRYRDQFGGTIPPALLEALNLKQQVLDQLVQQVLMRQAATQSGLLVGSDELRKAIEGMEAFRDNGVFKLERYKERLASSRMNPADFEEGIRSDLLTDRILLQVSRFATATDAELAERFAFENDRIRLEYVSFAADAFRGAVKVTDEALAAYYEAHKQEYQSEPQARLRYLSFRNELPAGEGGITDQEIEQFYQLNQDRFTVPEQRQARHILIRSEAKEPQAERDAKRERLKVILAKAKAGEDFAKLARENSEDGSAAKGGDLGFFGRGQMVQPFEDVAFGMAQGEISDIVESRFGLHIIKLEEIRPAKTVPLAEVKAQIAEEFTKQRGRDQAWKAANQAYEGIMLAGSLDKYAGESGKKIQETGFFGRNNPPAELADAALLNTVFNLKKGELSSLIETKNSFVILFVEEVKEPQAPPLAEVRARVEQAFRKEQARKLAKEAASTLLTAVKKEGASLAAEAVKAGAPIRETPFYSRAKVGESGLDKAIAATGLQLGAASPWPETVAESGDSFLVLHFKERQPASPEEFAKRKALLTAQMRQEKERRILEGWLASLQSTAKVTINQQLLGTPK